MCMYKKQFLPKSEIPADSQITEDFSTHDDEWLIEAFVVRVRTLSRGREETPWRNEKSLKRIKWELARRWGGTPTEINDVLVRSFNLPEKFLLKKEEVLS